MSAALYVEGSQNEKLGPGVDCTYVSIEGSCPPCVFRDAGCYAQGGFVALHARRLDESARGRSPLAVAQDEAKAIDRSHGGGRVPEGQLLRLHVSGDCSTDEAAFTVGAAAARWLVRGGRAVWTYTHAWRQVPRGCWGPVNVLASIEDPRDGVAAMGLGYVPALVVPHHDGRRAREHLDGGSLLYVPCPAQTDSATCSSCQLCAKTPMLRQGWRGIAFAAHGATVKTARHLPVLDQGRLF